MPRILSVEDDVDLQQVVAYALKKKGWDVVFAYTGPEGVVKAQSEKPDLILLDMMLPGLNGVEVIKQLKLDPATKAIPVIVMTAYPSDAQFLESAVKALGAVEYLAKPVRLEDLTNTIAKLLGV